MTDGQFGSSPKDRWLAILSLIVCVVGIVNAQLMAVTERFREIGTFKCLGALNSFVVRIFVLEGIYQGIFGGLIGSLLGILVSTLSLTLKLGWAAILFWPPLQMLFTIGLGLAPCRAPFVAGGDVSGTGGGADGTGGSVARGVITKGPYGVAGQP